jgi:tetratricopeptide (TPR) repeat protein
VTSRLDPLDPRDLERLLERAEREPEASAELDLVADLVAAAELQRAALTRAPRPAASAHTPRRWILAAAASVLFLVAVGLWYSGRERAGTQRGAQRLVAAEAPRYLVSELRAPGEPDALGFEAAMEPYVRADWAAAALALEACLRREPEHGPSRFYLAAAREQLGELDAAEEHYTRAAAAPDPLLSAHARLRLARLWLARGERERARAELERLRGEGGELASSAAELLAELARR